MGYERSRKCHRSAPSSESDKSPSPVREKKKQKRSKDHRPPKKIRKTSWSSSR